MCLRYLNTSLRHLWKYVFLITDVIILQLVITEALFVSIRKGSRAGDEPTMKKIKHKFSAD
jgi:hypothetical protein